MVLILMLSMPMPTMANISTSGLTAQQKATLKASRAEMQLDNATKTAEDAISGNVVNDIISDPDRYAKIGTAIAKSIGAAANELNVEVNNFASSDVGKLVIVLTVYHFFGAELITFFVGFFLCIPLIIWLTFKIINMLKTKEYIYDDKGKVIGRILFNVDELNVDNINTSIFMISAIGIVITFIEIMFFLP